MHHLVNYHIEGNFRGRKFLRISRVQAIRGNIIRECLVFFFIDKDGAIALIRENIICEMLYFCELQAIRETFLLRKFSRYTVFGLVTDCIHSRFDKCLLKLERTLCMWTLAGCYYYSSFITPCNSHKSEKRDPCLIWKVYYIA